MPPAGYIYIEDWSQTVTVTDGAVSPESFDVLVKPDNGAGLLIQTFRPSRRIRTAIQRIRTSSKPQKIWITCGITGDATL
ncbi:MAG: hypothetical protein ACLSAP_04185 [Oscillospiraceae bacterium]